MMMESFQHTGNITSGFTINSAYVPAIMLHKQKYENRSYPIKPAYYALYCSFAKPKMLREFYTSFPEMKEITQQMVKTIEGKIVGILHVKKIHKKGDPDYPNDPYANGEYTHAIDFIPIPTYIAGEHKRGQVNYMSLSEETKKTLNYYI